MDVLTCPGFPPWTSKVRSNCPLALSQKPDGTVLATARGQGAVTTQSHVIDEPNVQIPGQFKVDSEAFRARFILLRSLNQEGVGERTTYCVSNRS
jgi:hypothetical protein